MVDFGKTGSSYRQNNQVFERVPNVRKSLNINQRIEQKANELTPSGASTRQKIDGFIKALPNRNANDNLDSASIVGFAMVQAISAANDYIPGDLGADTEIVDVESVNNGTRYTVDVDAGLESQAELEAKMESSVGITGFWTEDITVESMEVTTERPARDTYRFVVTVSQE